MKILLISNMYPSENNPTYGTFVKTFEEQMLVEGFKFDYAVIRGKGFSKIEKIIKYINFFKDVISKVNSKKYDIIYIHYLGHSLLPLLFVKDLRQKKIIMNAHGGDVIPISTLGMFIQKIVLHLIIKSDLVVVPSLYFKDLVVDKFKIPTNKIFVSPSCGINLNIFKPLNIEKDKTFTIGYISRIEKGKGWDILIESINILKKNNIRNFQVLLIGSGSQEKVLIDKIKTYKLENTIEYLDAKQNKDLVTFYNKMDVFIFPTTLKESLGLVGLESMACGIPVIGSNIGALPSYIINDNNGKLFETGNSFELAEKIKDFMNLEEKEMYNYKINALKTAKKFDSKIIQRDLATKIKEVYNE